MGIPGNVRLTAAEAVLVTGGIIAVAFGLVWLTGCGAADVALGMAAVDQAAVVDLASVDVVGADLMSEPDLSSAPDLAWTDLAGGVDIAQAPDLAQPAPDLATLPPDMACAYSIGTLCQLNTQCACTSRKTCDVTGDSYVRCCVYKGDACASSADCCQRAGVGNGSCIAGKCG